MLCHQNNYKGFKPQWYTAHLKSHRRVKLLVDGDGKDNHGSHADEEEGRGAAQQEHQTGFLLILTSLVATHLQQVKVQGWCDSVFHSPILFKLSCHSFTTYLCAVYLFPNSADYPKSFVYLTSNVKSILTNSPFTSVEINVYHGSGFPLNAETLLMNWPSALLSLMS